MDFTDDTSAFDGKKIEQLAGKGTSIIDSTILL